MNSVIITGAGKGIGLELTHQFLKHAEFNVIGISRDISRLKQINHPSLQIIQGDLCKEYHTIINSIKSRKPQVQILINNAALVINKTIEELQDDDLYPIMELNFFTPLKLVRDLKNLFSNPSHIINISSMSGFQGSKKMKGLAVYSASKAALGSLTSSIAVEFASNNIYCNCIALGSVDTDMIKISIPGLQPQIKPVDAASFISQFALTGHQYCNGQIIPITLDEL